MELVAWSLTGALLLTVLLMNLMAAKNWIAAQTKLEELHAREIDLAVKEAAASLREGRIAADEAVLEDGRQDLHDQIDDLNTRQKQFEDMMSQIAKKRAEHEQAGWIPPMLLDTD